MPASEIAANTAPAAPYTPTGRLLAATPRKTGATRPTGPASRTATSAPTSSQSGMTAKTKRYSLCATAVWGTRIRATRTSRNP